MANHDEFLETLLHYQSNLRTFIRVLVRNREDCEDVFQETAMTLWRKRDEYDPGRPFGAWAKGIAVKKVLQYRTKSGRVPTPFSPETIDTIVDAFAWLELRQPSWSAALDALEKCVKTLSEHYREIIALRYKDGCSISQIAERLDSSSAAVKKAVFRIRGRLYDCVERQLGDGQERST